MAILWVDSTTNVSFDPLPGYVRNDPVKVSEFTTKKGVLYSYAFAAFIKLKIPVEFMTNSDANVLTTWCSNRTDLFYTDSLQNITAQPVRITNKKAPVYTPQKPYTNLYKGTIEIQATSGYI